MDRVSGRAAQLRPCAKPFAGMVGVVAHKLSVFAGQCLDRFRARNGRPHRWYEAQSFVPARRIEKLRANFTREHLGKKRRHGVAEKLLNGVLSALEQEAIWEGLQPAKLVYG